MPCVSPTATRKRVALLVETSLGSGREILRGIAHFVHQSDSWQLFHVPRSLHERIPDWMRDWRGDGIIARVQDAESATVLRNGDTPVIDVLGVIAHSGIPLVHVDDDAIAREVAEHFRLRDFQDFAFYGIAGENWSERRRDAFRAHCADGRSFHVLEIPRGPDEGSERVRQRMRKWLRDLPKPVAVMVCSDQRGLSLLEACREEGIAVPERIAVASVDNDVPLCEISSPPLTSVRAGHFRVGFEAASLLDGLMAGKKHRGAPIFVPPTGIVARRSSDIRAIEDAAIAEGLHFIHENLATNLSNTVIAAATGLSRTLFQRRFLAATGQTIRDYIVERRLRRARGLIENSELSFAEIAERSGFRHQEYMGHVLKSRLGRTPGSLRKSEGA